MQPSELGTQRRPPSSESPDYGVKGARKNFPHLLSTFHSHLPKVTGDIRRSIITRKPSLLMKSFVRGADSKDGGESSAKHEGGSSQNVAWDGDDGLETKR